MRWVVWEGGDELRIVTDEIDVDLEQQAESEEQSTDDKR